MRKNSNEKKGCCGGSPFNSLDKDSVKAFGNLFSETQLSHGFASMTIMNINMFTEIKKLKKELIKKNIKIKDLLKKQKTRKRKNI